ncbi:MAG: LytTR family transcriptional regulator [Flavobacteriaceae bacterium]|nr:LytTR family transcriptional regulator [Flavobacteriaceae bacterium]
MRCHRSYIINVDHVQHISGNLQGYQLELSGFQDLVPVSRSYTRRIKTLLLKT